MAALFDFDSETGVDPADVAFAVTEERLRDLGGKPALDRIRDYRRRLSSIESIVLAEHVGADGDTRKAQRAAGDKKTSRAERRKRANRAKAVDKNPSLADKMATNEMSEEQVDVIADAANKSDGAAAVDEDLIDKVASVDPDQGRGIAKEWLAKRATAKGTQTEHDRQRALRRAFNYYSKKNGLAAIHIEGDAVAVKNMWDAMKGRANLLYQTDGGRDVATRLHPRTRDQRNFDAAHELLCGVTTRPDGITNKPRSTKSGASARCNCRAKIVIGLTLDKFLGRDPESVAEQIGLGVIPDSVLADYAEDADIFAALYDRRGEPLWLARLHRNASATQRIALIIRDKGCARCGADHQICDVHHLTPFNAPAKGKTNIDELALTCPPCHHYIHDNNLTLYRDAAGAWRTRPATPAETPPPQRTNRPQRE